MASAQALRLRQQKGAMKAAEQTWVEPFQALGPAPVLVELWAVRSLEQVFVRARVWVL